MENKTYFEKLKENYTEDELRQAILLDNWQYYLNHILGD